MKKLILAAAISSLFAAGAMAQENTDIEYKGGRIEGGSVAHDAVDFDDEYDGFVVSVGYDINKNFGYSVRFSQAEDDYKVYGDKVTETVNSLGGYIDFGNAFIFDESFFVKPYVLVGVEVNQFEVELRDFSASEREMAFAYGAGVRVTAMKHLSLSAEIKRSLVNSDYDVDFDTVTVMAGYRF